MTNFKLPRNKKAAAFLLTGILFIAAGIFSGEIESVFIKAVHICLECIGIG